MNIVLWMAQVLLALAFLVVGMTHAFLFDPNNIPQGLEWMADLPRPLLMFIGLAEIAGALGVVLPWATGIQKQLTPLAAALLALMMLLAIGFHLMRGEMMNIPPNVVLLALAAFVAWGRYIRLRSIQAPT